LLKRTIYKREKRRNHLSLYDHFLLCCEHLGIPGMKEFLNYLLAFDYLIANTDRPFGNFGAVRNVNDLKERLSNLLGKDLHPRNCCGLRRPDRGAWARH
jgi:hypothetical protein